MATSRSAPSAQTDQGAEPVSRRPSPWARLDPGWQLALGLLIALRLALGLFGFLSYRLLPPTWVGGDHLDLIINTDRPWSQVLSIWQRWDALWYQYIAEHGYHASDDSAHFQPLFPLLSYLLSLVLGGAIVLAQLLVVSAAFLVAMWLLYRLARIDVSAREAQLTLLLVALFPTGFFLLAPYTESLFLLTTVAAFWFARHDRPWLAGLAGMCASLTRTFGIILVLPLAFEYLRQRDEKRERVGVGLLAATLPVVALIGLTLYQQLIVGVSGSPFQLARHWGQNFVGPWDPLPSGIQHVASTGDPIEVLNIICLLGFTALALYGLRWLPLTYWLYVLPYLALLYCQHLLISPLASVDRYTLPLFPCFIVLARLLVRYPWLAATALAVSGAVQLFLFDYWIHFGFVA